MTDSVGEQRLSGVSRTVVLDAALSEAIPVGRVEVRRIQLPAGTVPGLHVHNGPVFGSIVQGSVAYQQDGEPVAILTPGDVFYEPGGVRIARFDALEEDVTFLAYYLLAPGQDAEIEFPAE